MKQKANIKKYPTIENPTDFLECIDTEYSPYRFEYNQLNNATEYLLQNGFVVIKNVLNNSELQHGKSLLWNFLQSSCVGWDKNDYNTWDINKIGGELKNGLLWGKGIGHSDFQWFGRKHPKVLNIFGSLWTHIFDKSNYKQKKKDINPLKDLLTSFSGISLFTPWYLNDTFKKTNSGWYHIDQNVCKKMGLHTIQGYISYLDQNESTGSTVFIPKTHLKVKSKIKEIHPWMGDFVEINPRNSLLNSKIYKKILLCCNAGDMVLWDSRTIHCSSPALLSRDEMINIHLKINILLIGYIRQKCGFYCVENIVVIKTCSKYFGKDNNVDLLRLVSMICMVPKCMLKKQNVLAQRVQAYIEKMTLSHWPTECVVLNRPKDIGKNKIKNADDLTKSLLGLTNA